MEYYEKHMMAYLNATPETRKASKAHWLKCHKENIKSKRDDLIIFSAKMLASIAVAESFFKTTEV